MAEDIIETEETVCVSENNIAESEIEIVRHKALAENMNERVAFASLVPDRDLKIDADIMRKADIASLDDFQRMAATYTGASVIEVASEIDMLMLAYMADQGESFAGITIKQTEDIYFTKAFPGLYFDGDTVETYGFRGTFDGNGYVMRNLTFSEGVGSLFDVIAKDGCVENVAIVSSDMVSGEIGWLSPLAWANFGTISNYHFEGTISGGSNTGCVRYNFGVIENVTVDGSVSGEYIGTAGIACYLEGGIIRNCTNSAVINNNDTFTAGIAAEACTLDLKENEIGEIEVRALGLAVVPRSYFQDWGSRVKTLQYENLFLTTYVPFLIQECSNYGVITASGTYGDIVAGIVASTGGLNYGGYTEDGTWFDVNAMGNIIRDCSNYADLTGGYSVAGIVGTNAKTLVECCVNYGDMRPQTGRQAGGIVALEEYSDNEGMEHGINECVNYGDIYVSYNGGGIAGHTGGPLRNSYNRGRVIPVTKGKEDDDTPHLLGGLAGSAEKVISGLYTTADMNYDALSGGLFGRWDCHIVTSFPENVFFIDGSSDYALYDWHMDQYYTYGNKTAEWLKSTAAVEALGSSFMADTGINDGYPILKWQAEERDDIIIQFFSGCGTAITPQMLSEGDKVTIPVAPEKEGYTFNGWYTDPSYTTKWNFQNTVTEPMCLYARWYRTEGNVKWKVTINPNGGYSDELAYYPSYILAFDGDKIPEFPTPVKDGYRFKGWGIDNSTTSFWNFEEDVVVKAITLKAVWEKMPIIGIRFFLCGADNWGGEEVYVTYAPYGSQLILPVVTKNGCEYVGWFTKEYGEGTEYKEGDRVYESIDLYVYWISNERFTVTFDTAGGNSIEPVTGIREGDYISLPVPVKGASIFLGWYTEPDGEGSLFTEQTRVKGNMTLYAHWRDEIIENGYRISPIEDQTYTGDRVTPEVIVYKDSVLLTEGTHYSTTYVNCVETGMALVRIRMKDGGVVYKMPYEIKAKNIAENNVEVTCYNAAVNTKNGKPLLPKTIITYSGKELVEKQDYTISLSGYTEDMATVLIKGKGNFTGEREVTVSVKKENVSGFKVAAIPARSYTGQAHTPAVTITDSAGNLMTAHTDFICRYASNVKPGTASVEIIGIGKYAGSKKVTFKINKKNLADEDITVEVENLIYNGNSQKPEVVVKYKDNVLEAGVDYSVKYSNNKKASQSAVVTVTGKGSYTGKKKENFIIQPKNVKELDISVEDGKYKDGKEIAGKVTVKDGKTVLRMNKDYTITYKNNMEIGTATVMISGIGNYIGDAEEKTFRIVTEMISKAKVTKVSPVTYDGSLQTPKVTVYLKNIGDPLKEGTDYIIEYPESSNKNAGTGKFYIVGCGIYGGRKAVTYKINKCKLDSENTDFELDTVEPLVYTGGKIKAAVTLKYKEMLLKEGTDYTLSYSKNTNVTDFQ